MILYILGGLHHTGSMWKSIKNASTLVKPGAIFMIGIYNKKPPITSLMHTVKKKYCYAGPVMRALIKYSYFLLTISYRLAKERQKVFSDIKTYKQKRGMNYWRDLDDWLGGYPYECATPGEIYQFVHGLGFELVNMTTGSSFSTVNQYLFRKNG